ncbi:hypothetical protein KAK07_02845 [Ideonella sp. 4Y16]|uniref:hypothetical protein n=1 Tax=Ideonella alba TaxID=2824118 RepID=UPI001B38061E|nr:hypothetical protein [Ideonella alba]MBQ0942268.1 hypothetical protein [Ideonella alba]
MSIKDIQDAALSVDGLVGLLQHMICQPFPSGSLVPRRHTDPGLRFDTVTAGARHIFGAQVARWLPPEKGREHFHALFVRSARGWWHRHLGRPLTQDEEFELIPRLFEALLRGDRRVRHGELTSADVTGLMTNVKAAVRNDQPEYRASQRKSYKERQAKRGQKAHDGYLLPSKPAYHPDDYGCHCLVTPATGTPITGRAGVFVEAVMNQSGGKGKLLTWLFLKQVHSHLSWVPAYSHANRAACLYAKVVARLDALAWEGPSAWQTTASLLVEGLEAMAPFTVRGQFAAETAAVESHRPDCFDPFRLGLGSEVWQDVLAELSGYPDMIDLAGQADALALEVAAWLTDAVAVAFFCMANGLRRWRRMSGQMDTDEPMALGWREMQALKYQQDRPFGGERGIMAALQTLAKALDQAQQAPDATALDDEVVRRRIEQSIELDYLRDAFRHRRREVIDYAQWCLKRQAWLQVQERGVAA